jgi:hypothetical protein
MLGGRSELFPAYLSGRIGIEASFGDMLRVRRILR